MNDTARLALQTTAAATIAAAVAYAVYKILHRYDNEAADITLDATPTNATTTNTTTSNTQTTMNSTTPQPIQPVTGRISSPYGHRTPPCKGASSFHNGVDVAVPTGTAVRAPWNGTVDALWTHAAGGISLRIKHTNGYITGYCHLSRYEAGIKKGATVTAGQTVAYSGATGNVTGPHLHFTLRLSSNPNATIDPQTVFNFQ